MTDIQDRRKDDARQAVLERELVYIREALDEMKALLAKSTNDNSVEVREIRKELADYDKRISAVETTVSEHERMKGYVVKTIVVAVLGAVLALVLKTH